jgi:hypothetical protein
MAKVVTAIAVAAGMGWSGTAEAQRDRVHGAYRPSGVHRSIPGGLRRAGWARYPRQGYPGRGYPVWAYPGGATPAVAAELAASARAYGYYPYGLAYDYYPYPAPFPYCSYYPASGCYTYPLSFYPLY